MLTPSLRREESFEAEEGLLHPVLRPPGCPRPGAVRPRGAETHRRAGLGHGSQLLQTYLDTTIEADSHPPLL